MGAAGSGNPIDTCLDCSVKATNTNTAQTHHINCYCIDQDHDEFLVLWRGGSDVMDGASDSRGLNSRQVVHTHEPLSPSNINWYVRGQEVVSNVLWLGK